MGRVRAVVVSTLTLALLVGPFAPPAAAPCPPPFVLFRPYRARAGGIIRVSTSDLGVRDCDPPGTVPASVDIFLVQGGRRWTLATLLVDERGRVYARLTLPAEVGPGRAIVGLRTSDGFESRTLGFEILPGPAPSPAPARARGWIGLGAAALAAVAAAWLAAVARGRRGRRAA